MYLDDVLHYFKIVLTPVFIRLGVTVSIDSARGAAEETVEVGADCDDEERNDEMSVYELGG